MTTDTLFTILGGIILVLVLILATDGSDEL